MGDLITMLQTLVTLNQEGTIQDEVIEAISESLNKRLQKDLGPVAYALLEATLND